MSKWKKKNGIAIAINSFIASEKYQLPIVTGDHILVNEGNDDWLLGRNLFTHKVGIFPYICVYFNENSDISIDSFLSSKSDILIYEAEMTIRYAFTQLQLNSVNLQDQNILFPISIFNTNNPSFFIDLFKLISDVTTQIDFCMNHSTTSAILAHSLLSESVDNLRKALGLEVRQRSLYSSVPTISTWGRKVDPSNPNINALHLSTKSSDQPIVLYIHLGIKEIFKPVLCKFYLYDAINKSYLSAPTTVNVDPSLTEYSTNNVFIIDLFYEKLERKYISNNIYLIIYIFETKNIDNNLNGLKQTNKTDDEPDDNDHSNEENELYSIKKCLSCVLMKLPELNCDSLGNSTITEIKSFTIKRDKFNILTFPETISNNLSFFQSNLNLNFKTQEEKLANNEYDETEEYYFEDENIVSETKKFSLSYKDIHNNTRKTVHKLPPLVLDSPNIQQSSSFLSPSNSPRYNYSKPISTTNTSVSSSFSSPNLTSLGSSKSEDQYILEGFLNKLNLKIIRYPLNFSIKITPYSGLVENIFNEEKLQKGRVISPYHITSLSSQNESNTILSIQLRKLKLDVYHNKYSLIIVRLLDITQANFVRCFQSFQDPNDFNCESWICPVIKSTVEDQFYDFFSINLNAINLPFSSLLLVIEAYKINSGFRDAKPIIASYGFLPLFKSIENSTPPNNGEILFYNSSKNFDPAEIITTFIQNQETIELIPNPKPIGSISYRFDSNNLIQYINLYKLFHYRDYTAELKSLINNFMFFGINEWLMNTKKILLNLCSIISSMDNELASEAFRALQLMLSSLNKRFNDSLETIINLIENSFDPTNNSDFLIDLQNLADVLLPLIIDKLSNETEDDQEFRNLIKTLPLFLQLVARSYALKPNSDRKSKVLKIFDLLNQLLKKDVSKDEESTIKQQEEAKIFMNQRLLLSHFWKLVDILPSCFDKNFATEIIYNFISSIKDDKESLFAEKMKLLLTLSSKDIFWINNSSKNKLNDIFTHILNLAVKKKTYMEDIYNILTGIMYSSNSRFIISFLPFLEQLIDTNRHESRLIYMLFTIAFNFPESFPLRLLNKLIFPLKKLPQPILPTDFNEKSPKNCFIVDYDEILTHSERLFIYIYVTSHQKEEIIKKFKYKIFNIFEIELNSELKRLDSFTEQMTNSNYIVDSNTIKYKIFLDVFNIIISSTKPEKNPFDSFFLSSIYNFNNFSILPFIFHSFKVNQRLYLPMIKPLLHSMILYPSKDLAELFYMILKADIKINKDPINVKRETLNALWKISSNKYMKNGSYYTIIKDKSCFKLIKDEFANERKDSFKKLIEFNHLCKQKEFIDLASSLFAKESIPVKNNSRKQSTPKYKKGIITKEQVSKIVENFADLYSSIVRSIAQIRVHQNEIDLLNNPSPSKDDLIQNEDKITESIRVILKSSIEIKNEKFWRKLIEMICRLHLICGNKVEAATSLNYYLSLVPCSDDYLITIKKETLKLFIDKNKEQESTNNDENNNNKSIAEQNSSSNFWIRRAVTSKIFRKNYTPLNSTNTNNNERTKKDVYNCVGGWNSSKSNENSPFCQLNGRELHVGILLKMIDLCITSNNESVANKFIDQLQSTIINKFHIIELMPIACKLRQSIYETINSRSNPSSNFFRASFFGKKFDKFFRNRTFIYRRDYRIDGLNKFKAEMKEKFPEASFGQLPSEFQNQDISALDIESQKKLLDQINSQFIIIQKAVPTTESEVKDPFFDSCEVTSYVSEISGGYQNTVFRCESPIEKEALYANVQPVFQQFLRIGERRFPSIERRIEIESCENSFFRKIDPLTFALISLQRNRNSLIKEANKNSPFIEKVKHRKRKEIEEGDDRDESIQIAMDGLNRYSNFLSFLMQENTPNWKCFKDFFLQENYLFDNPDDSLKVEKLSGSFNEIVELLGSSIAPLMKLKVPKDLKKDFRVTEQLFKDLKIVLDYETPNQ